MPVKIPNDLPAARVLEAEGIATIPESLAFAQDIRPLQVAIFNVMPDKPTTETHLLRLLSNSPLQLAVTLLHPGSHVSKNTPPDHLAKFYKKFVDVAAAQFDCLIVTGAPVETLEFNDVRYWNELQQVLDWSRKNVYSTMHICWGAQAGLYHHFRIPKYTLEQKLSGIYRHRVIQQGHPLLRGFDDIFFAPHSRHTGVHREDILRVPTLQLLAESDDAGVYLASTLDGRQIFVSGHPEYDRMTLKDEYERDEAKGLKPRVPLHYFPNDDPTLAPIVRWRSHASLFFTNWLQMVYLGTPFDLNNLELVM